MQFKPFQLEDLARAALHNGVVLGQDTGLGKGLAAFVWPILKVGLLRDAAGQAVRPMCPAEPVLLVASGDLHQQIIAEGLLHFGVTPTIIEDQAAFLTLAALNPSPRTTQHAPRYLLPPGYYLTTYTALSRNGVVPFPPINYADPHAALASLHLTLRNVEELFHERRFHFAAQYALLNVTADDALPAINASYLRLRKNANEYRRAELDAAFNTLKELAPAKKPVGTSCRSSLTDLSPDQQTALILRLCRQAQCQYTPGIDDTKYFEKTDQTIKCVYSASLADLCSDAFAVLVADEAVKIKSADSFVGLGTRQMNPRFRLPMTGTPIKNRLPDLFYLMHFAAGGHQLAQPRFPFGVDDQETFANEFCVSERNRSAEDRSETNRRYIKLTPQVCNIHLLWKLIAPIVLRRRKADCGEAIVKKHRHVVRVPMGVAQARAYKFHLDAHYLDRNKRPAVVAQLHALRIVAANPSSALLKRPNEWDKPKTPGDPASKYRYIPKVAAALNLIQQILARGEQVVVGSAFNDSLDVLSDHLREAGIRHEVADGRTSPERRGQIAARFKRGRFNAGLQTSNFKLETPLPVLLCGVDGMAEGHSFPLCSNVILMAYSWAWDKFEQFINRVHRLNSPRDVNVYSIICDGSIDRKLEGGLEEKGNSSDLVLDGHLLGENPVEVNLAELLQIAHEDFAALASQVGTSCRSSLTLPPSLIDERELIKEWPTLRTQLARAMRAWDGRDAVPRVPDSIPLLQLPPSEICNLKSEIDPLFASMPLWQQAA